jgi:hypothetical protein
MLLKPFNEHLLWKGKLQRYNAKSKLVQPPMDLPIVNSLTGYYDPPRRPSLSEEREYRYSLYSAAYWAGVKERQRLYRSIQPSEPLQLFYS